MPKGRGRLGAGLIRPQRSRSGRRDLGLSLGFLIGNRKGKRRGARRRSNRKLGFRNPLVDLQEFAAIKGRVFGESSSRVGVFSGRWEETMDG